MMFCSAHRSERGSKCHCVLLFLLLLHSQVHLCRSCWSLQIGEGPRLGSRREHVCSVGLFICGRDQLKTITKLLFCLARTKEAHQRKKNTRRAICFSTFRDDPGWAPPLQHGAVLNGWNQLFLRREALLLRRRLPVKGAGSSSGSPWGAGGLVLGSHPCLGRAPSCGSAAAVGKRERTNPAVQGVRGSTGACRRIQNKAPIKSWELS